MIFRTNVPYLILYQLTKFQRHIFYPCQDITQNVLLSSWFRQLMTSKQGKNEEKTEMQKFEYLENEKSFLDQIKSILRKCYQLANKRKIADTSFN